MATAMERKFTSLRKRLDQMGYRQPLGVESLPLVERLFGDLLHTTDSLKNAKLQLGKQKEQKVLWEKQAEPYRSDNARILKENCEVHQQLLSLKESHESRVRDFRAALRRLEHENADLKFLNTQYMHRLMTQEKESQAKSGKMMELQEKNLQAVIQTPGGRKKQVPFRRQRMEIDTLLPPKQSPSDGSATTSCRKHPEPDPYVADLLKVADERIASLQQKISEEENEKKRLENDIHELTKQVERRENEVDRLMRQLKGGRPPEALAVERKTESNERMVAHLNIQVDCLQQTNQDLEAKLAEEIRSKSDLQDRVEDLSSKNARICTELKEIGGLVKQMEKERENSESDLKRQVTQLKKHCHQLSKEMEVLVNELKEQQQKGHELFSDNQRMAELLATAEGDSEHAANLLEKLNKEKKVLTQQLRASEAQLKRSLDRIDHEAATNKKGGVSHSATPVRKSREDRDELEQMRQKVESLTQERDNVRLLYEQVTEELNRSHRDSSVPSTANVLVRRLERERADMQLAMEQLTSERDNLKERLTLSRDGQQCDLEEVEKRNDELVEQLSELSKERNDQQTRAATLQQTMHTLEEELKELRSSQAIALEEKRRMKDKIKRSQGLVDSAEKSKREQQKVIIDRSSVSESNRAEITRLTSQLHRSERTLAEKEQKMKDLGEALSVLDEQHDELRVECDQRDEKIVKLEELLKSKATEITDKDTLVTHLQGQLTHSQSDLATRDKEITSLRKQLVGTAEQLTQLQRERESTEEKLSQLRTDLKTMTHENQALHVELHKLGEEKEALRVKVEEYASRVAQYEDTLAVKEQEKADLLQSHQTLTDQLHHLDSTVQQTREQDSSIQLHIAALQQEKIHLEELIQQQAMEIEQHVASLQAYELQLSNLTNSLSLMEQTVRQEHEEKNALLADLAALKELCVQMERTKESLTRQLASMSVSHEQLQQQLTEHQAERASLNQQIKAERSKVEDLESLLSNERRKEYHSHVSGQEKHAELQQLRQQLQRVENERLQLSEQLRKVRSDTVVKSEEVQRLKAELVAEKYQKQHIQQQLDRLRSTMSSSVSSSSSSQHSPRQQSHHTGPHTPPKKSVEVDELIAKEHEDLANESARLVNELISTSNTSAEQQQSQ